LGAAPEGPSVKGACPLCAQTPLRKNLKIKKISRALFTAWEVLLSKEADPSIQPLGKEAGDVGTEP
jgi:hypothetical protein